MSREEELLAQKNDELREILEDYELPTDGNKAELVDRIVRFELGVPEAEDASDEEESVEDHSSDEEFAATDADAADTPPEPEARESQGTDEDAESEGDSSDKVLIKYTGSSPHYQEGRQVFSVTHPYAVVSAEEVDRLVKNKPRFFRPATQGEVERYYA